jgi:hypothetical protein
MWLDGHDGAAIMITALHKNHGGRRAMGRLNPRRPHYDLMTVGPIAEISGLTNCFNRGTSRELRLYSSITTRTRVPGNTMEEKANARA